MQTWVCAYIRKSKKEFIKIIINLYVLCIMYLIVIMQIGLSKPEFALENVFYNYNNYHLVLVFVFMNE